MAKVLTEKHPFMKKVNALYDYMEKNRIGIRYAGYGRLYFTDTDSDQEFELRDSDTGQELDYFPTGIEFKLRVVEE